VKIQRTLLLFGAALIAAFLLFHFFRQPSVVEGKVDSKANYTGSSASESAIATNALTTNSVLQTIASPSMNPAPTINDRQKTNAILQYMESQNKPIEFYGQVVDQDENPISDAEIKVKVRHWDVKFPAPFGDEVRMIPVEMATDLGGRFEIHDVTGDVFDVESIRKDGYTLSPKTPNGFGPSTGSFQNPVIIKMWKLGESQQLISHRLTRIGILVDGQPVQFELFGGKKVSSGGQLIMRLKREPQILPPGNARYDWNLELEIPRGGLAVNNDEFMYQAPEDGYHETFQFDMPKDAENWTTALDQQFYIQLENEKYFGSLFVHLSTIHNTPPLGINLDIVINPNGSRNLQP
jgi:hypothetical protein